MRGPTPYNYRWFSKNCFAFFTHFDLGFLLFHTLYVDFLDLKLNIFPKGIPGLFWKLKFFYIHIWLRGIFYSLSYTYTWMVKNAKFDFENFVIKPMRGRVSMCIWRMLQICFVVLKQLRVQSFHNWCIDIWQIYLLFTWLYFRFENHSSFSVIFSF